MLLRLGVRLVYVFGPTLPAIEKVPVRRPSLDHGIVWFQRERLPDQTPRLLVLPAFHAKNQRDGPQQKARLPERLTSFGLALDMQYVRIDPRYDWPRDEFVQSMHVA